MKRRILCTAIAILGLASCHHPDIEVVDFDTFHVTSVKSAEVLVGNALNPDITFMETGEEPDTKVAEIAAVDLVKELLSSIHSNSLVHISGTYTGHDIDGSPITLSGKLLLPAKGPVKNMILVSHFTIGANYECPSESFPLESILAGKGYAVVLADYIGFGVTKDRIHPYMHVESTARSAWINLRRIVLFQSKNAPEGITGPHNGPLSALMALLKTMSQTLEHLKLYFAGLGFRPAMVTAGLEY